MSHTPAAIEKWVEADRRQDLAIMREQLAPDVHLISPLTDVFTFNGRDEVMAVFESAFELLTDIEIYKLTGAGNEWVLYGKNKLKRKNLEEIQWLTLNSDGLISEITLFIRPVVAAADLLSKIGKLLARRGVMGKGWSSIASILGGAPAGQLKMAERLVMPRLKKPDAS